jgi:ABC-type polysaccharide/polyol phosphate export permease
LTTLAEYKSSRELVINLTLRELRTKYKRSLLGWSWSLLHPLAIMAIFTLVFSFFLRIEPPVGRPSGLDSFPLFLLCGLLPWTFVVNGTNGAISSLLANANLIKKSYFPRELLVTSQVLAWLASFAIEMMLLAVVFMVVGNFVLPYLPVVVLIMVALSFFIAGMGLALSAANVYFRDVEHLVAIAFQVWFYLTPILYPISLVPERPELFGYELPGRALYGLNPMVGFVEALRDCLYDLRLPSAARLGSLLLVSAVTFLFGLSVFKKLEGRLAEEL